MSNDIVVLFKEWFDYANGKLVWKKAHKTRPDLVGKAVGSFNGRYFQVQLFRKPYQVHRIIFALHHGYLPKVVDHIDGNTKNNDISNLRASTSQQNNWNRKLTKRNKTGIKNVYVAKQGYKVGIEINNKSMHFGYFDDLELAELVAVEARNKYHGNFANHGVNLCRQ